MKIHDYLDALKIVKQQAAKIAELESLLAATAHALRRLTVENIPENWPGKCVLTRDELLGRDGKPFARMNYLSSKIKGPGTIADHRAASEILKALE